MVAKLKENDAKKQLPALDEEQNTPMTTIQQARRSADHSTMQVDSNVSEQVVVGNA